VSSFQRQMTNQIKSPKSTGSILLALFSGLLPWFAGLLVIATRNILSLAVAGALVCVLSTTGTYLARKSHGRDDAKIWLIAEPFLFGCYYAVSAVLIHYVLLPR
jgi:uncharacterized membrane protein